MLSSTILRQRGDCLGGRVVETVAGMHLETRACGEQRAIADKLPLGTRLRLARPSASASHQAPVWISITGAPSSAAISICAGRPQ